MVDPLIVAPVTNSIGPDDPLRLRSDDLVWRRTGEEVVVLDLRTSTYHVVNPSGAELWEHLAGGTTSDRLGQHLADSHGRDAKQARREVTDFVAGIRELGLLENSERG